MGFSCGIVGLPNVGKSTLFNALTATAQAEAANYPFTTIEPNVGRVAVPDERLKRISELARTPRAVPTYLEFVDIAGLVRGASRGEGLGNQFLAHIREVDAICHVLRCFEGGEAAHVEGTIDPVRDAETVETELLLADLESMERRAEAVTRKARGGDREARESLVLMEPILEALREGRPARRAEVPTELAGGLSRLHLLTEKPVLYVCNVDEASAAPGNEHVAAVRRAAGERAATVVVSAALEAEVAELDDPDERMAYLAEFGLAETGLSRVIHAGYRMLDLVTFFSAGPKETRAWTIPRGTPALEAAGVIHSDFQRGFIRAETISYEDYVACAGEQGARDAGRMRQEGRDYVVQDGDIILFRFNV
ncbi:MAG: redox-regulated ATPase YchF [Alphaproteobacteria bacterium]